VCTAVVSLFLSKEASISYCCTAVLLLAKDGCTDGFRACAPLQKDSAFNREYVVHGKGGYADDEVHVNTCESHIERF